MNILTFDVEDWFHLLNNTSTKSEIDWLQYPSRIHKNMDRVFELLDTTGQKATFFCLGWIAQKYPEIVRKIDELGYEIGSHSHFHQLAYQQNRKEFTEDLHKSINCIEDLIGKKVKVYRTPGFSLKEENKWVFEVLVANGIEVDSSIFPAHRSHGGFENFGTDKPCWVEINGVRIKEFPMNLASIMGKRFVFSGGGYFRLFPYSIIDKLMNRSTYVMTYFHPRDFDCEQPVIEELSLMRKFQSYYGLQFAEAKLQRLLLNHPFTDLQTATTNIDWANTPVISL